MARIGTATGLYPYIAGLDGGADTVMEEILDRVEDALAGYLNLPSDDSSKRQLAQQVYTWYQDGPSASEPRMLQTPYKPLVSITSIHCDDDWEYGSDTEQPAADRVVVVKRGQVWLKPSATSSWSTTTRSIKVVGTVGYDPADPPGALLEAVYRFSAVAYEARKGALVHENADDGPMRVRWRLPKMPGNVKELIRDYRCPGSWLT